MPQLKNRYFSRDYILIDATDKLRIRNEYVGLSVVSHRVKNLFSLLFHMKDYLIDFNGMSICLFVCLFVFVLFFLFVPRG